MIKNTLSRITFLAISSVFFGCSHTSELTRVSHSVESINIDYSVIYYIHSDADYLYHKPDGRPIRANSKVLKTSIEVAKNAHSGEVFIYYQRPEKKILGIFPRRSSLFYHYMNGEKKTEVKYRHSVKDESFLATEIQLYNQYRTQYQNGYRKKYMLFFGHEIPDGQGKNYHRTLPDIRVNVETFAAGIRQFLIKDDQKFELVVLSACDNGTPVMAEYLMPFSDVLLASPQNLHLSHINSDSFTWLNHDPEITPIQIARLMVNQTYSRLAEYLHTTFTLSVYDLEYLRKLTDDLHTFNSVYRTAGHLNYNQNNIDCTEYPIFEYSKFKKGVDTWYKPARFGRQPESKLHSGWGCKPVLEH